MARYVVFCMLLLQLAFGGYWRDKRLIAVMLSSVQFSLFDPIQTVT